MNDSKLNVVLYRDGDQSPVTIDQDKCLIRTVKDNQQVDCCAIFNGPCGTALRSYTDNVLVNGEPTVARWLNVGDQIQLPCLTRLEVKASTLLKPVLSLPPVEAVGAPAPKAEVLNAEAPEAQEAQEEETFHSPFSQDLSEIEDQVVRSEPVADAKAPNAEPTNDPAAPAELASIFARMGVTNVGSIANPGAVADPSVVAEPSQPSVENSQVEQVVAPATTSVPARESMATVMVESTPEAQTEQNAEAERVRGELHAMFTDVSEANRTPAHEATARSAQPTVLAEPQVDATPASTGPVANVEVAPAPEAISASGEQPESDPLAELPDDLRNQLNDLVSSLENETPKAPEGVSTTTAAVASAAVASTAAVTAAVMGSVSQPAAKEAVAEEAKPVRDESISSMFEDAMRAIQSGTQSSELASVESIESAAPVQASAGLESIQAAVTTPAVTTPAVTTPTVPETPAAPAKPESQSVTDILGRMGMAIPGEEEMETAAPQAAVPVSAPTPQPEPVATPAAVPVVPEANESATGGDAEDDIQAYMNQLLNRAKPDSAPVTGTNSLANTPLAPKVVEKKEIPKVLSEEEFVPTHKATRPENYDSLREIANTSTRTAVNRSNREARKAHVIFKLVCGLIALCLAGAAFCFGQNAISGILAVVAVLCFVLCSLSDDSKARKEAAAALAKLEQ